MQGRFIVSQWRLPDAEFFFGQGRSLFEQGAHAVGAEFGGWVQPAKQADPAITSRQQMLEKAADELVSFQLQGL